MQNVPNIVRERLRAAQPAINHPDADVLTAFAEHSLQDRERSVVLDHLARCGDCRDIVALALPATESLQAVVTPSPSRWLTWPALRWGLVAAGIVALGSFGILQYQRRLQPATTARALQQPSPVQVATNEPRKSVDRFDSAPEDKKKKLQTPSTPAFVDSADANAVAQKNENEKKTLAREEASPTRVLPPQSGGDISSARGTVLAGSLPHGPRLANQWQQNNAQNQGPAPQPPSALTKQQNATGGMPANSQMSAQEVAVTAAAPAIAKAKPSVPLASPVEVARNNQPSQDQAVRRLKAQAAPGQIGGYVVDPSGAVVSNARITVTPSMAGGSTTAVTNSQGAWLIAGLSTGNYKAQAEAPGFKSTVLDLNYDANQPSMYSFTLSPGSVSEVVEVSSADAPLQSETASIGSALSSRAVSPAPVNGRSLAQLDTLSRVLLPRWSINASGALQRSLDQGHTWQTVDVVANPASHSNSTSVEIVAKASGAQSQNKDQDQDKERDEARTRKRDAATLTFRTVAANGSDVWAGGSGGVLYHSLDAGNTWTRVVPSSAGAVLTGDIISVQFSDSQHGKLSTSTSEIWTTNDAGQSWQKQ